MSASGLYYVLTSQLQDTKKLAAYYDFSDYNAQIDPASSGPYTGILYNQFPAYDTGKYTATIMSATGASDATVSGLITGAVSGFCRLDQSNLKIPIHELTLNDMSVFFDFEWNGGVNNGVLFGSYDRFQETLGSNTVTGSKGFNFGFDDRGNLFFECFKTNGPAIYSTTNIELSKRNLIGFTVYEESVVLSQFDYFNDEIYSQEFDFDSEYIGQNTEFYIGGSQRYFRTANEYDTTISGKLHELAIFSGSVSPSTLKRIGSGILGDYYFNTGTQTVKSVITGYNSTPVYATGVTGVELASAGTLTVSTGRVAYTGLFTGSSSVSGSEGDDTYVFYNFDNGDFKTTYKEKIGYLDTSNSYEYAPTGENAFDTLGLQAGSFTLSGDVTLSLDTRLQTGSYEIYQKVEKTGILDSISGVTQTPIYENITGSTAPSSGIIFNDAIETLKKDYIYYKGLRL